MKSPLRRRWVRLVLLGLLWVTWGAVVAAIALGGRQAEDMPKPQAAALGLSALALVVWLVVEIALGFRALMGRWALVMLVPIVAIAGWTTAGQPRRPVVLPSVPAVATPVRIVTVALVPFPEALSRVDGIAQRELEAQLNAAWSAELRQPVDTARITVHLSPTGVQGNTEVFLFRKRADGTQERAYTKPLQPGEYSFDVSASGGLASPDTSPPMTSDLSGNLSCECLLMMIANANYRGVSGAAPRGNDALEYELAYGKWEPRARTFFPAGSAWGDALPGAMSDLFSDGNQIQVAFADVP